MRHMVAGIMALTLAAVGARSIPMRRSGGS